MARKLTATEYTVQVQFLHGFLYSNACGNTLVRLNYKGGLQVVILSLHFSSKGSLVFKASIGS